MLLGCVGFVAFGQVEVKGTVYDQSQLFALPGVSVLGTSGRGTMTDSAGHYTIVLTPGDSIYFSYLGRRTAKFPVKRIAGGYPMDMSLAVRVDSLPLVVVRPKPYRYDSAENRDEYRNVFDYQPTDVIFNGRKNRQMLSLQRRLLEEEQDKYVNYRFNKNLVKRITGLRGNALDALYASISPDLLFHRQLRERLRFLQVYKDCGVYFQQLWQDEHPE